MYDMYVPACMFGQSDDVHFNSFISFDPHANMRRVKAVNEFSNMGECCLKCGGILFCHTYIIFFYSLAHLD